MNCRSIFRLRSLGVLVLLALSANASAEIRLWSTLSFTNNSQVGANFGGRAGLDAFCAADPNNPASSITGAVTRAFVSVNAMDEIRDMPANYSIPTNEAIRDIDDTDTIASNFADLLDGTIMTGIVNENSGPVNAFAFTGSFADGSVDSANNCSGFTSDNSAEMGRIGSNDATTNGEYLNDTSVATSPPGVLQCGFFAVSLFCVTYTPVPTVTATSTAAGFNTTNGTNLNPATAFGAGDDTLMIDDVAHMTGSVADGGDGDDTINMASGVGGQDFTALNTLANFETLTFTSPLLLLPVTMNETQHESFTNITGVPVGPEINLVASNGDGIVTGFSDVIAYTLTGDYTFNLRSSFQNVTGDADGRQTIDITGVNPTGTLNGGDGRGNIGNGDTLRVANNVNLSAATISNFETLSTVTNSDTISLTTDQHNSFASVNGQIGSGGTTSSTLSFTNTGTLSENTLHQVGISFATALGGTQVITIPASRANGRTLSAADPSVDRFIVTASTGAQTINGSSGNDDLSGGAGDDIISGSFGNDTINGGSDNDTISPGLGADMMTGGTGNDTFRGSVSDLNGDTITDLEAGDSLVVRSVVLANVSLAFSADRGSLLIDVNDTTPLTGPEITLSLSNSPDLMFSVSSDGRDTTITFQNPVPTITSATYDGSTGVLDVTGTNLLGAGASAMIDVSMLTITGEDGGTRTLTAAADVSTASATSFSVTLTGEEKTAVDALLTANGTQSEDGTTYNLGVADDWNDAFASALDIADLTGNAITVSNFQDVAPPTILNINRQSPATQTTSADTLVWHIEFSETIPNSSTLTDDFVITGATGVTIVVDDANPAGDILSVTVSGGNLADLDGTITLGFAAGQNIADSAGNVLANTNSSGDNETSYILVNSAAALSQVTINDFVNNSGSTTPTVQDFTNIGVTGVTEGNVLTLINNAIATQPDATTVDSAEEIQTIVNAILEGQDADGDSLPNLFEGPSSVDSDGDGTANRDDTDSDNDGISDQVETGLNRTDSDNDGIIDIFDADVGNNGEVDASITDANFDGVSDNLAQIVQLLSTNSGDTDLDGIANVFDADADGDSNVDNGVVDTTPANGIIDSLQEAYSLFLMINGDSDIAPNHLDLDSDNDGLTDVSESSTNNRDVDQDAFVDAGQDLITDVATLRNDNAGMGPGQDNVPNYLDRDSDGTSFDIMVLSNASTLDGNNDGEVDDRTDTDNDGIVDAVDNFTTGFGANNDTDGDGIPNSEDLAPNGTDVSSSSGVLANGVWILFGLLSLMLVRARKLMMAVVLLTVSTLGLADGHPDHGAHQGHWHNHIEWQVGVGQTEFDLDTPITFTDDRDPQFNLSLGYRITENWLVQYRYSDLGIQRASTTQSLEYTANSLNVQGSVPVTDKLPISVYGLLGVAALDVDVQGISIEDDNPTEVQLGVGVQGRIEHAKLGLEVSSYGEDLWAWSVTVGGHF